MYPLHVRAWLLADSSCACENCGHRITFLLANCMVVQGCLKSDSWFDLYWCLQCWCEQWEAQPSFLEGPSWGHITIVSNQLDHRCCELGSPCGNAWLSSSVRWGASKTIVLELGICFAADLLLTCEAIDSSLDSIGKSTAAIGHGDTLCSGPNTAGPKLMRHQLM